MRSRTCLAMPSNNNIYEAVPPHSNSDNYGTLHVDRKKEERDRKTSMDPSITRRPSLSRSKLVRFSLPQNNVYKMPFQLGKPRSLSTCPVYPSFTLGPNDGIGCHNPESSTTPTFAPYLYATQGQDRKFSLNSVELNGLTPDELTYFQDASWNYSENGDNYGTRRARSTNSVRKSLFSGRVGCEFSAVS